jgi:hypothetical protein
MTPRQTRQELLRAMHRSWSNNANWRRLRAMPYAFDMQIARAQAIRERTGK